MITYTLSLPWFVLLFCVLFALTCLCCTLLYTSVLSTRTLVFHKAYNVFVFCSTYYALSVISTELSVLLELKESRNVRMNSKPDGCSKCYYNNVSKKF